MNIAEWIGHTLQNWPIWIILTFAIGAAILFYGYTMMFSRTTRRYEWPDDKKKRLAKEEAKRVAKQSKLKFKKG